MKVIRSAAIIATLSLATGAQALPRSPDSDGCWDGRTANDGKCLKRTSGTFKNGRLDVEFVNQCSKRVYGKICIERTNGSDDCGASGVSPNETFSNYNSNSSGRYLMKVIGSTVVGNDWVCSKKISNWK